MTHPETFSLLGHYCGRFDSGFWGEPLNSLTNISFPLGSLWAWNIWRQQSSRPIWVLVLIVAAALIGLGSFVFHSQPSPNTLMGDLIPIQIFALLFLAYALRFRLGIAWLITIGLVVGFFAARQVWIMMVPPGFLGGGASHLPALLALGILADQLRRRADPLWRYLVLAIAAYILALIARTFDPVVCAQFPWGLHWLWHLMTAATASALVIGAARHSH